MDKAWSDWSTGLHKILFQALVGLVAVHVGAVLVHWLALGDNLIPPMLTGAKTVPVHRAAEEVEFVSPLRALLGLALAATLVWSVVALA